MLVWWWGVACSSGTTDGPNRADAETDTDAESAAETDTDADPPAPGLLIAFLGFRSLDSPDGTLEALFFEYGSLGTLDPTGTTSTPPVSFDQCIVTPIGSTPPTDPGDTGLTPPDASPLLDPGVWSVSIDGAMVGPDGSFPWVDGGAVSFSNEGSSAFPAANASDFFFLPPQIRADLSVEPDGALTVTWNAGPVDPTTAVGVIATSSTASLYCLVTDDGAFTIPASQAAEIEGTPFALITRSKFGGAVDGDVRVSVAATAGAVLLLP